MEETMYEIQLPEHWTWAELKDLTENSKNDIVDGPFGSNLKSEEYKETGIPVFKIQNIKENRFVDKNINFVSPTKAEELSRHSFQKGDLIITKLGNPLGLCCKVPEKYPYGIIVADLMRFRPSSQRVVIQYLMYGINSVIVQNQFKAITKGTTRPRVNLTIVRGIKFPLPPLSEQRAIVSKIELLFSELDNGIANLKLAQEQLKIYRQAVLKKGFEGELTKKWREQQTDLPDAGNLLEQIKREREEASKASGKKLQKVRPLNEAELTKLPKIPKKWIWVRLDDIGELFCGQSPSVAEVNQERCGVPYVTGPEQWDGRKINETKWTEFPKRLVPEGCIFITVKGAGVGKIFPGISCAIGRDIYAFLPSSKVDFKYTIHALKYQIDVLIMKAQGDIPGLSKDHILDHYIGLCSKEEQQVIVQEIETRLSVCDKIEQDIEANLEKAEALRQSILKKAFEGKLLNEKELAEVRRAEDCGPAEVLLEGIKAEREENGKRGNQMPEQLKKIIRDDKEFTQQSTLQVFEQVDK
jgi:type I restriction enzyme S subunit